MHNLSYKERARLVVGVGIALGVGLDLLSARRESLALTLAWSAVLFGSFVGWGSLVNLWLAPGRTADFGLRAGWGMSLCLFLGGFLVLARVAYGPVLIFQITIGVAVLIGFAALRQPRRFGSRRLAVTVANAGLWFLILAAYGLALLMLLSHAARHDFQPSDDPPLYFVLAKKIVQNGTIYEPFNPRRISTLGGQQYLHALFISVAPLYYLDSVDSGLGTAMVLALLVGHASACKLKAWHAVPIGLSTLLLFSLSNVRVNTASLMTGVATILTLYRTLRFDCDGGTDRRASALLARLLRRSELAGAWIKAHGRERPALEWLGNRRLAALGVLTSLAVVLRTSNITAVLPFIGLALGSDAVLSLRRKSWRIALTPIAFGTAVFVGSFFFTLLPWSLLLKRSCGTFFFPLGHNNLTPGWQYLKRAEGVEPVLNFMAHFAGDRPISTFVPFAIAGLAPLYGRARNDLVALTCGSLIGLWVLAREASAFDASSVARYYFAFAVATALLVAASAGQEPRRSRAGRSRMALAVLAVAVHVASSRDETRRDWIEAIKRIPDAIWETPADRTAWNAATAEYLDIQSHTEPGTTIATAVHEPWRFDFKRNRIFTLDQLGSMGPPPGWPVYKGGKALADYFRANGIRYVAWTEFDVANELYNRPHWRSFLGTRSYLGYEAPFHLDGMSAVDQLATLNRVVYRGHQITIVDLSAPALTE